ncbi:MAG: tyrosine-type recombinase/integrase [Oscillospiraceae bacterium]|nr:tyrosine-type recombinase/integrase [Oscillospiraceae bacterium]
MNFPEFDYHSLRHAHATMLLEQEAPPKYVQKRLGHKNIEVTLNIYAHLTKYMSEQGTAILNNMFA